MQSVDSLKRHQLVWLDPAGESSMSCTANAEEARVVRQWIDRGRPLVAARRHADTPNGHCALGLPLPPSQGKRRIALCAPAMAIRKVQPPPTLRQVMAAAPPGWQEPLQALEDAARDAGIGFRVFGSLAWQYLTAEPYLSDRSDIDLLWRPTGIAGLRLGLETLRDWERRFGLRPDGEIELPDGTAVAWRELAAEPSRVLVKAPAGVALRPLAELLRELPKETVAC